MAFGTGNDFVLGYSGASDSTYTQVAKLTDNTMTQSANPVDTSNKDDDGYGSILAGGARKNVTFTGSFIYDGSTEQLAVQQRFNDQAAHYWNVTNLAGIGLKGKFIVTSLTRSGPAFGAETWTFTLQNVGAPTRI